MQIFLFHVYHTYSVETPMTREQQLISSCYLSSRKSADLISSLFPNNTGSFSLSPGSTQVFYSIIKWCYLCWVRSECSCWVGYLRRFRYRTSEISHASGSKDNVWWCFFLLWFLAWFNPVADAEYLTAECSDVLVHLCRVEVMVVQGKTRKHNTNGDTELREEIAALALPLLFVWQPWLSLLGRIINTSVNGQLFCISGNDCDSSHLNRK